MKAIKIIITVTLLLINIISSAQEKGLTEEQKVKAKIELEQYFEKLQLTETQKQTYEAITRKYGEQLKFIKESGLSKQKKIKEVQRIQADKDKELKQLLSEQQYQIYQDFKVKQRKTIVENYSGEFTESFEKLNLTESQKETFIKTSKRYANELKTLKNSSKSRFSKYRTYKDIQNRKNKEMKALLSSQQYKVYLEIQKDVQKKIKEQRSKK